MRNILIGVVLIIVGGILDYKACTTVREIPTGALPGYGPTTMTVMGNTPLMYFATILLIAGGIMLLYGIYKWERKKAIEIITEGTRKGREEK